MSVKPNRVVWCDRGILPPYFGFCPNEKAWHNTIKRLKAPAQDYPTSDASCTALRNADTGVLCVVVTLADKFDEQEFAIGVIGLIVHEAMHVWRYIREDIGEHEPSTEFEAYAMHHIVMELLKAYKTTRPSKTFPKVRQNAISNSV